MTIRSSTRLNPRSSRGIAEEEFPGKKVFFTEENTEVSSSLEALASREALDGNPEYFQPLEHLLGKGVFRRLSRVMFHDDSESPLLLFGRFQKLRSPEPYEAAVAHPPFTGILVFHKGDFFFDLEACPRIFPEESVFFASPGSMKVEGVLLFKVCRAERNQVGFSFKGTHAEPAYLGGAQYLSKNLVIRNFLILASHAHFREPP
jgi:hypothetical protein